MKLDEFNKIIRENASMDLNENPPMFVTPLAPIESHSKWRVKVASRLALITSFVFIFVFTALGIYNYYQVDTQYTIEMSSVVTLSVNRNNTVIGASTDNEDIILKSYLNSSLADSVESLTTNTLFSGGDDYSAILISVSTSNSETANSGIEQLNFYFDEEGYTSLIFLDSSVTYSSLYSRFINYSLGSAVTETTGSGDDQVDGTNAFDSIPSYTSSFSSDLLLMIAEASLTDAHKAIIISVLDSYPSYQTVDGVNDLIAMSLDDLFLLYNEAN